MFSRLLVVFAATLFLDIVSAAHFLALGGGRTKAAVVTVVLIYVLAAANSHLFIEEKRVSRRLLVTLAQALGAGVGTFIVCSW